MRPIPFLLALLILWSCERPDDFRSDDMRDFIDMNATTPRLQVEPFPNYGSHWIYCGSYQIGKHEHHIITDSIWYAKDTTISIQEDFTGGPATHSYKLLRVLRRDYTHWIYSTEPQGNSYTTESEVNWYHSNRFIRIDNEGRWISLIRWISPTTGQQFEREYLLMDFNLPIGTPWVADYSVANIDTVLVDDRWAVRVTLLEPYRTIGVQWVQGVGPNCNSLQPGYDGWQTTYLYKKHFIY